MNKNTKRFLIGTMTTVVIASSAIALTNTSTAFGASTQLTPSAPPPHHDSIDCQSPQPPAEGQAAPGAPRDNNPPADGQTAPGAPRDNNPPAPNNSPSNDSITTKQGDLSITISGGHETDPRDKGRPVVLIASALGVSSDVFRDAFSGVMPAGLDRQPLPAEAQRNKAVLLKALSPYGITNDRLDEVSNFYRYNRHTSDTWRVTPATVNAIETDGVVTGIQIVNPGAGYSSNPLITIKGPNGTVTATTTVSYTRDFQTNGSLASVTLNTK